MENPATWGEAEKVIRQAYDAHSEDRAKGVYGLSLVRRIADALREAGLLEGHCASCDGHACEDEDVRVVRMVPVDEAEDDWG